MPDRSLPYLLGALLGLAPLALASAGPDALQQAISAPDRSPKFVARDAARHPYEELRFLGIAPDSSVAEIYPGGGYWTEILAPYLRAQGRLVEVLGVPDGSGFERAYASFPVRLQERFAAAPDPARPESFTLTRLGARHLDFLPASSVDTVVTFRNLHNWIGEGDAPMVLAAFHRVLKSGGVLGIEDHRARPDQPQDPRAKDGYVRQDYAIALVEKAGFKLVGTSEVLGNPRDTTHWPAGVWTLPPTYRLGATDRDTYAAVGEADNFLLKFRKVD